MSGIEIDSGPVNGLTMVNADITERIKNLPVWSGDVTITPLEGGLTNVNYKVTDGARCYVVRLGQDILHHHVLRFNELAASRAAHAAGLSPAVVHSEVGLAVLDFIDSVTFTAKDVQNQANLERILPLIKTCHFDLPKRLRGPVLAFSVFHIIRDYCATLSDGGSGYVKQVPDLLKIGDRLEAAVGPVETVFGHNDLLAANFLDDGARLWLIDWDYAGFGSPLFDLGGLASNCDLSADKEVWLLENYFDLKLTDDLQHRYQAMKCAAAMREMLWSMVSELSSDVDHDFAAYTADTRERFEAIYEDFPKS